MFAVEKQNQVINMVAEIENLPPFPLLSNIIKSFIVAESAGDIRPLISNIESEPNIVAKAIGVANSALFGTHTPVRSIKDAIMRLGVIQLKSLVFSIIVSSRFNPNNCPAFKVDRFWRESMLSAYCASLLADRCRKIRFDRNEVYSIALIHHIGLLALINVAPDIMDTILADDNNETLLSRERKYLSGIDHLDAGAALLRHWHLPKEFWLTIEHTKDDLYEGECADLVKLLNRANELIRSDFSQDNPETDIQLGLFSKDRTQLEDAFENDKSWILSFATHL